MRHKISGGASKRDIVVEATDDRRAFFTSKGYRTMRTRYGAGAIGSRDWVRLNMWVMENFHYSAPAEWKVWLDANDAFYRVGLVPLDPTEIEPFPAEVEFGKMRITFADEAKALLFKLTF